MTVVDADESLGDWATERLETEISLVAAQLAAGECRWLQLVAQFDQREAWRTWGCASAAHWLNYRCGVALGAGRERVRVARRLMELPRTTAAFAVGELSYSKVRAITRAATAENEEVLVDLALCMTASQLEHTVRLYRQVSEGIAEADPTDAYRDRYVHATWNDDGTLSIRAKLPAAEGAIVMEALQRAADALFHDRTRSRSDAGPARSDDVPEGTSGDGGAGEADEDKGPCDVPAGTWEDEDKGSFDVPAGTSEDGYFYVPAETSDDESAVESVESPEPSDSWGARQADALVAMAETVVADGLRMGSGPNRHTVIIHTTVEGLLDEASERASAYLENGPALGSDTARRLMCDSSLTFVLEGPDGAVVNVSGRAPSIPSALARAVRVRDGCCVFPGCTRQAFVDIHHIHHRIDGGENTLTNCAVLCRVHHRMVHEGGYTMSAATPGRFEFCRPDGVPISTSTVSVAAGDSTLRAGNAGRGVYPTAETAVPNWDGSRPDYGYILDFILDADGLLRDDLHRDN